MNSTLTLVAERTANRQAAPPAPQIGFGPVTWLPWATAPVVATAAQERAFVADLADLCRGMIEPHLRSDTTAILNALRGGLSLADLLDRLPGLRPARLFSAYLELDALRADAVAAWAAIAATGTLESLVRHGATAERLVPVLVDRVRRSLRNDPDSLSAVIAGLAADVAEVDDSVERIEERLAAASDVDVATVLSQSLYNLTADCVFARCDHVPGRVGALMPTHVAGLLGERVVARPTVDVA